MLDVFEGAEIILRYAIDVLFEITDGSAQEELADGYAMITSKYSYCDVHIYKTDLPGYTISDSNRYYCLMEDSDPDLTSTVIEFSQSAPSVKDSTIDCLGHNIDGLNTNDEVYGIYLGTNSIEHNIVKNCDISNFNIVDLSIKISLPNNI